MLDSSTRCQTFDKTSESVSIHWNRLQLSGRAPCKHAANINNSLVGFKSLVCLVHLAWAVNLVCLTTSHSSDGFFSVSMLSSSATDKIYRYTGGDRLCLVYCRSFIAVAFIFQCDSPTSDHNLIAVAITELVYRQKRKSERSELQSTKQRDNTQANKVSELQV